MVLQEPSTEHDHEQVPNTEIQEIQKCVCSLTVPFLSIPKPFYQTSFFPFLCCVRVGKERGKEGKEGIGRRERERESF